MLPLVFHPASVGICGEQSSNWRPLLTCGNGFDRLLAATNYDFVRTAKSYDLARNAK